MGRHLVRRADLPSHRFTPETQAPVESNHVWPIPNTWIQPFLESRNCRTGKEHLVREKECAQIMGAPFLCPYGVAALAYTDG